MEDRDQGKTFPLLLCDCPGPVAISLRRFLISSVRGKTSVCFVVLFAIRIFVSSIWFQ